MSTRDFKRKNIKAAFCQGFCEHKEADFLSWLERIEEHGEVLKDDKKAILLRSQYDGKDLVIKHYKYIGVPYALIHAFTKSRAQHSWQASLKMAAVNIPTPRALACVERCSYGVVSESYFIYEYEEGTQFRAYAWSTPVETILAEPLLHQVYRVLHTLKIHRINHGDLKTANIIVTEHGPVLIDLDQVRCHIFKHSFAKRRLRDLKRFRRELPWNRMVASHQE
jgi:tRNA A-37 threonylcarbamoyl transferase component Bud32